MQYIHLSNDSYILRTSQGMHTLERESFNFNKIKRLLSNNAEEEKILPLLQPPELPDGIYKAYIVPSKNDMYFVHITKSDKSVNTNYYWLNGEEAPDNLPSKFAGVYASKEDLILDWPEYTI
jgi:hypothetical protein